MSLCVKKHLQPIYYNAHQQARLNVKVQPKPAIKHCQKTATEGQISGKYLAKIFTCREISGEYYPSRFPEDNATRSMDSSLLSATKHNTKLLRGGNQLKLYSN